MAAVPTPAALAKAERLVRDIYRAQFAKQDAAAESGLAKHLLAESANVVDDPAGRFVLLRDAFDLALSAREPATAIEAAARLQGTFAIPHAEQLEHWSKLASLARTPEAARPITTNLLRLSSDAVAGEDYDIAVRSAMAARSLAQGVADLALVVAAQRQLRRVEDLRQAYASFTTAERKVRRDPADKAASLTAGSFLCFARGQWARGLPLLAAGSDRELATLAARDMANPADPIAQVSLADGWWDAADRCPADAWARPAMRDRAVQWYRAALGALRGLVREKAEVRIRDAAAEIASLDHAGKGPAEPPPTGTAAVIDLLTSCDSERDTIDGHWVRTPTGLRSQPDGLERLTLRYEPRGEYDLHVEFTRVEGRGDVVLLLSHAGHRFAWSMGAFGDAATGFGRVGGKVAGQNAASVPVRMGLTNGHRYDCVVRVRDWALEAYLDGKLLVRYRTDYRDLTPPTLWDVGTDRLGIGAASGTVFHRVEVVEEKPAGSPTGAARTP